MEAASVQNQAQLIVDTLVDRMFYLVEQGRTDCAVALHKELKEWIALEHQDEIEALSIDFLFQ